MRFLSFTHDNKEKNNEKLGVLSKDGTLVVELSSMALSKSFSNMIDLIRNISESDLKAIEKMIQENNINNFITHKVEDVKICSPIKRPIHDIICVGVNYKSHLEETRQNFDKDSFKEPKKIVYFSKRAIETIGPDDNIISHADIDEELDYEVELAVIIGKKGINIKREDVEDYIFGYTIINDISARKLQQLHSQWYRGKSLDSFTSLGPVIVHKSEIPFPVELNVCSRVNGELRQNSNTKHFLADIPAIISEFSKGITLEPGDIIATGTPSGVGMGFNPPKYMKPGDIVECEIENIGILRNTVK